MIHRVADRSQVSYHCELLGKEFVYSIKIVAGTKVFSILKKGGSLGVMQLAEIRAEAAVDYCGKEG
jgi:hypothetical protein